MSDIVFTEESLEQFAYFAEKDRKGAKKIFALLRSINREGLSEGLGKPEPLRYTKGYSRRIDEKNRLVYDLEDGKIVVKSCKGHYDD